MDIPKNIFTAPVVTQIALFVINTLIMLFTNMHAMSST